MTRNDYSLGLMNGDIGIALRLPERNDDGSLRFALRVAFPRNDGSGGVRSSCRAAWSRWTPCSP